MCEYCVASRLRSIAAINTQEGKSGRSADGTGAVIAVERSVSACGATGARLV
jgi:hypothetical protein